YDGDLRRQTGAEVRLQRLEVGDRKEPGRCLAQAAMKRAVILALVVLSSAAHAQVTKYVRYSAGGKTSYGILDGSTIRELSGDLFASPRPTAKTVKLDQVKLLAPVVPG